MVSADVGVRRIGQISVTAHDLDRARQFYRDTLGLRYLFDAPPRMSFFESGGVRLLVGVPERGEHDHPSSILYFDVPDIAGAHAVLEERGVEFVQPPHRVADLGDRVLWLAFFRDSEGNTQALMSEVPKTEP